MGKRRSLRHIQIIEIFKSVQGEGRLQGEPTVFIRTAGCNLRCRWCDTSYASGAGRRMSVGEVVKEVGRLDCPYACVTGGEPLLQTDIQALFDALKSAGHYVLVETNGTLPIGDHKNVDRFVVDYKLPGAGAETPFMSENLSRLRPEDELKFVVADRADYETARRFISENPLPAKILLSPCNEGEGQLAQNLVSWMLEDGLPARFSLQIHKALGVR